MLIKILFLGDVVGRPGRRAAAAVLGELIEKHQPELVIANGENIAGGHGLTESTVREVFAAGVDLLTTGNHAWAKREGQVLLARDPRILRPVNFSHRTPGRGATVAKGRTGIPVGIILAQGRTFLDSYQTASSPFDSVEASLDEIGREARVICVEIHAEATSEKMALGWYLNGRVTAVWGTHTHVQTADERVLPGGTAYITDVGMTGPLDSVIGTNRKAVIEHFLSGLPRPLDVARGGPGLVSGIVVRADAKTGRARGIERIYLTGDWEGGK